MTSDMEMDDIVPLYKKESIPEKVFMMLAVKHLSSVPSLPLDFLQKVSIVRRGCFSGLFAVSDTGPDSSLSYTSIGDLPDEVVVELCSSPSRKWKDSGLEKYSYMFRSDAESLGNPPMFVSLPVRFFEWSYKGMVSICYYNPVSKQVVTGVLPVDKSLGRKIKRARLRGRMRTFIDVAFLIASAGTLVYYAITDALPWHLCFLIWLGSNIVFDFIVSVLFSGEDDLLKSLEDKRRSLSNIQLQTD